MKKSFIICLNLINKLLKIIDITNVYKRDCLLISSDMFDLQIVEDKVGFLTRIVFDSYNLIKQEMRKSFLQRNQKIEKQLNKKT